MNRDLPQPKRYSYDISGRSLRYCVKAGVRLRGKLASEVLFCSLPLRFHVVSPYRDCRHCNAPYPGKEKQKCYDYRCAVLIIHRFRFPLCLFTQVMRKIRCKVTRKMASPFGRDSGVTDGGSEVPDSKRIPPKGVLPGSMNLAGRGCLYPVMRSNVPVLLLASGSF